MTVSSALLGNALLGLAYTYSAVGLMMRIIGNRCEERCATRPGPFRWLLRSAGWVIRPKPTVGHPGSCHLPRRSTDRPDDPACGRGIVRSQKPRPWRPYHPNDTSAQPAASRSLQSSNHLPGCAGQADHRLKTGATGVCEALVPRSLPEVDGPDSCVASAENRVHLPITMKNGLQASQVAYYRHYAGVRGLEPPLNTRPAGVA